MRAVGGAAPADGPVVQLNTLQEALQPAGDTCFAGLSAEIRALCRGPDIPLVVKEVGRGLPTAEALSAARRAAPGATIFARAAVRINESESSSSSWARPGRGG